MSFAFVSYASGNSRAGNSDRGEVHVPLLDRFCNELTVILEQQLGLDRGEALFKADGSIPLGEEWRFDLNGALQSCRAFIAVYSPYFFGSEWCGKEWAAFKCRLDEAAGRNGSTAPLILPVLWSEPRDESRLPACAQALQFRHRGLGLKYAEYGLFTLMNNQSHEQAYEAFRDGFARRLCQVVEAHPLAPSDEAFDLSALPSAFELGTTKGTQAAAETTPAPGTHVRYALVVGTPEEVSSVRTQVDCYPGKAPLWKPYHPECQEKIGTFVQRIAVELDLTSEVVELGEDFDEALTSDIKEGNLVAVLVDPWTVLLEDKKALVQHYDGQDLRNCSAFVLWNRSDAETKGAADKLSTALHEAFPNKIVSNDAVRFHERVETTEDLRRRLVAALTELQGRVIRIATALGGRAGGGPPRISPVPE